MHTPVSDLAHVAAPVDISVGAASATRSADMDIASVTQTTNGADILEWVPGRLDPLTAAFPGVTVPASAIVFPELDEEVLATAPGMAASHGLLEDGPPPYPV